MTKESMEMLHSAPAGVAPPEQTRTQDDRARKRADALRDNLKKRKAQSSLRASQTENKE